MQFSTAAGTVVHSGTGHTLHQQDLPVPTEIDARDSNAVIWSLMEVLAQAGVAGAAFDPDVPATYNRLALAIRKLGYPDVGSIEIRADDLHPADRYPGSTWVEVGQGRTLVGRDASDGDFNAVGGTGGAKAVTLGVEHIPPLPVRDRYLAESASGLAAATNKEDMPVGYNASEGTDGSDNDNTQWAYFDTTTGGGGQPHNNMPPWLVVRFWKRTA